MLKRYFLLLATLIAGTLPGHTQVFEPGLLVRSGGDTLRGELENGFWVEPPAFIRFRRTPASSVESFLPHQLRAVDFAGGRHFRYEKLPLDHAAKAQVGNLPRDSKPAIQVDSLLAEVLVDGPATLVQVVWPEVTHYVVLQAGRPALDLSEHKYLRQMPDGSWLLANGNNYRGQLAVYFGQCPAAYAAAQVAPFTAKGLIGVVQAYNEACSPGHRLGQNWLEQAAPRRRAAVQGGVLAGARYNRIESNSVELAGPCVDCQVHPFGGLYVEILQPSRTAAVFGELTASKFHSSGTDYIGTNSAAQRIYHNYEYRAWLGTARLGVRFFMPLQHDQQVLLHFGYELNVVLKPEVTLLSRQAQMPAPADLKFNTPVVFPNLGAGWRSGRVTLSVDAQMYRNNDEESRFGTAVFGSNVAVRAGLGYRLGRAADAAPRPAARP